MLRDSKWLITVIFIAATGFTVLFAAPRVIEGKKTKHRVVKKESLPDDHRKIVVNGEDYFFHKGVYYKKNIQGYKIVRAPYGARIRHIPDGYRIIRKHDKIFYFFYHTWYIYDDREDVYIVVREPDEIEDSYNHDKIYLVNGSVLIGRYLGGTDEKVKFLFNDDIQRIPIEEIISIEFAAAMD